MTDYTSNDAYPTEATGFTNSITYPLPPANTKASRFDMEVYAKFMRHLREIPHSRDEIKILSAIQFTADAMDTSDALVAKVLLDMGLRAPRQSFPATFLEFVDHTMARAQWHDGVAPSSVVALAEYWASLGDTTFGYITRPYYAVAKETVYEQV